MDEMVLITGNSTSQNMLLVCHVSSTLCNAVLHMYLSLMKQLPMSSQLIVFGGTDVFCSVDDLMQSCQHAQWQLDRQVMSVTLQTLYFVPTAHNRS